MPVGTPVDLENQVAGAALVRYDDVVLGCAAAEVDDAAPAIQSIPPRGEEDADSAAKLLREHVVQVHGRRLVVVDAPVAAAAAHQRSIRVVDGSTLGIGTSWYWELLSIELQDGCLVTKVTLLHIGLAAVHAGVRLILVLAGLRLFKLLHRTPGLFQEALGLVHRRHLDDSLFATVAVEVGQKRQDPLGAVVLAEDALLHRAVVCFNVIQHAAVVAHLLLVPHHLLCLRNRLEGDVRVLRLPELRWSLLCMDRRQHIRATLKDVCHAAEHAEGHLALHAQAVLAGHAL
mmetsp:Transcript_48013/g.123917  ORF Transcript_48013/g.123917 Transcript_48013/m.123917 type:complete len:288 (-) Transcript_48013:1596-2459(-)